ncbi:NADH-quinone oxidoreductase subunit NuoE family protein [Tepidibacter formicigenes]|jgi:NADH-quinone oxidoreductase subunit E/NADH-quinone oxidoreductase subunit F/NADP-reducing hydrogenase subunit HndA|uniref:NADH-quinone oxidoreductase subunit E n=1 Tax=Tepidibacter formicigenes DSM 15518 TaxID=1123349 RepID=A0A1M6LWL0_9FIRM|nr:NAD(P)H-dependent oxidoreductase subunit E [Tepidibacter formicigenes]SHJ75523.1 NADH-quinone oxidoreductase subunit E [Tepidibacter formicigenes DSM 15518]
MEITIEKHEKDNFKKLNEIIEKYKEEEGMLIRILQKSQEIFGYLPEKVQTYISQKLNIPVSTINGVVSFYSLFSEEPQGKYTIGVCLGTACYVKGAQDVLEAIKEELQIDVGETSMDKLFTLKATRCIGACGLAPVITINEEVHGRVSPADVPSILYKYIKTHKETQVIK